MSADLSSSIRICTRDHFTPAAICIAKVMDMYRVRLWLKKGPRCPCNCGERIPWKYVKVGETFAERTHIPTPRRPSWGVCSEERWFIPSTVDAFRAYLVERRHVISTFDEVLWRHCLYKTDEWCVALLSNGHATGLWRTPQCCAWKTPTMVFDMVKRGFLKAANILLSWPTTVNAFTQHSLNYLIYRNPCIVYYVHTEKPLTSMQRRWILTHPAMAEKTRALRTHANWMFVILWAGFVKSWMRECIQNKMPLPEPSMKNVGVLKKRLTSLYSISPGDRHYKDVLMWIAFLAKESPTALRDLLSLLHTRIKKQKDHWYTDLVETVAASGRVKLLRERLNAFHKHGTMPTQKVKVWQWADSPLFAIPCITKTLITMAVNVIGHYHATERTNLLTRKLFRSAAVVSTIDRNAVWFSRMTPDGALWSVARRTKSHPEVSLAVRNTPRYRALQTLRKFQATVYLSLFFKRHVRPEKVRSISRGDCPICWTTKILQPLHGDTRHGVCLRCVQKLRRNNLLNRCPVCRTDL